MTSRRAHRAARPARRREGRRESIERLERWRRQHKRRGESWRWHGRPRRRRRAGEFAIFAWSANMLRVWLSSLPKKTPTKIPRIPSRTSAVGSPGLGASTAQSTLVGRRISLNITGPSTDPSPTNSASWIARKLKVEGQRQQRSILDINLCVLRQPSGPPSPDGIPRRSGRGSVSSSALRKASTGSVASTHLQQLGRANNYTTTTASRPLHLQIATATWQVQARIVLKLERLHQAVDRCLYLLPSQAQRVRKSNLGMRKH